MKRQSTFHERGLCLRTRPLAVAPRFVPRAGVNATPADTVPDLMSPCLWVAANFKVHCARVDSSVEEAACPLRSQRTVDRERSHTRRPEVVKRVHQAPLQTLATRLTPRVALLPSGLLPLSTTSSSTNNKSTSFTCGASITELHRHVQPMSCTAELHPRHVGHHMRNTLFVPRVANSAALPLDKKRRQGPGAVTTL